MLSVADLEINLLEFRQRAFQFERSAAYRGTEYAVFLRTETESESQFRPKLLHLALVVPREWVVYDAANDLLAIARDGTTIPPRRTEPVVEVRAERPELTEQGIDWKRLSGPGGVIVYAPAESAADLFRPEALAALGFV